MNEVDEEVRIGEEEERRRGERKEGREGRGDRRRKNRREEYSIRYNNNIIIYNI